MSEALDKLAAKASKTPWHAEGEPDADGLCAVLVGEPKTIEEYMIGGFENTEHRNEVADAALTTVAVNNIQAAVEALHRRAFRAHVALINKREGDAIHRGPYKDCDHPDCGAVRHVLAAIEREAKEALA